MPNKFIKTLSAEESNKLLENHRQSDSFRIRNRSHAILLSFQKYSVDAIAEICQVHRTTVGIWIDKWNEFGFNGLEDEGKSGRPPILSLAEQAKAFETAMTNPKFPHRQLNAVKRATGKEISRYTLKRLVKKKSTGGKESS